jgi:hypothetical protein
MASITSSFDGIEPIGQEETRPTLLGLLVRLFEEINCAEEALNIIRNEDEGKTPQTNKVEELQQSVIELTGRMCRINDVLRGL